MSDTYAPGGSYSSQGKLSATDSFVLHSHWALSGVRDASRWNLVLNTVLNDAEIQANVLQSLILNGLSLLSVYAFDWLLRPLLSAHEQHGRLHLQAGIAYHLFWSLPLICISLYLNSTFCARTAKRAFTLRHGSRAFLETEASSGGLIARLSNAAPRLIMLGTSVALDFALRFIPLVGRLLAFAFLCWVDAYYFFEFVWTARGMPLGRRTRSLEERWAYFLAFGFPSAVLLTLANSVPLVSAVLFALIFPAHIILATHAQPVPSNPYTPGGSASASDSSAQLSPFLPARLPVFAPVLWLDERLVRALQLAGRMGPRLVSQESSTGRRGGGTHAREGSYGGFSSYNQAGSAVGFEGRVSGGLAHARKTFEGEDGEDIEAGDGTDGFTQGGGSQGWASSTGGGSFNSRKFD